GLGRGGVEVCGDGGKDGLDGPELGEGGHGRGDQGDDRTPIARSPCVRAQVVVGSAGHGHAPTLGSAFSCVQCMFYTCRILIRMENLDVDAFTRVLAPRLRMVAAVASAEHITRAAESLNMPQPTLSTALAGLQRLLGRSAEN